MSRYRKPFNRRRYVFDVGAFDKPQASSESLIEDPGRIAFQVPRRTKIANVFGPMKEAFVKTVAVELQPSQQRMRLSEWRLPPNRDSRQTPPGADIRHVDMR